MHENYCLAASFLCPVRTNEVDSMGYEMDVLDLRFRRKRLSRSVRFNPFKTI